MPYFRRPWEESRGDQYDSWGHSIWYFETDLAYNVSRQIEVYDHGPTLRYGPDHQLDDFGQLSDQPLDADDFSVFEIQSDEFERAWESAGSQPG